MITHAWNAPPVSSAGVPFLRIWSVVFAAGLTVLGNLLLRSAQPAAVSSAILIATGIMQTPLDAAVIMGGVILVLLIGEPMRRIRLRQQEIAESSQ